MSEQRLIDANKLNCLLGIAENDIYVKYWLDRMPTIDPEALPIVQELRKELERVTAEREALAANSRPAAYGEWEEIRDPYGKIEGWICKCGSESRIKSDFCPYCGADMRGKKEENQC